MFKKKKKKNERRNYRNTHTTLLHIGILGLTLLN